ncbi:hypothetical protein ACQY0O_005294 [Thecaphora frezii]
MPVSSAAKLATHLWRGAAQSAANAAHTSASTLRSALQGTAGSGAAGSSSSSTASSWSSGLSGGANSAGAGAGGAKYHAGRNAHFTYQNSGRALSQASSSTNNDGSNGRNDDEEDHRRQKAYQLRLRAQKGSALRCPSGTPNLSTIRMQARFRHAFSANRGQMLITAAEVESADDFPGQILSHGYSTQASAGSAATSEAIQAVLDEGSVPTSGEQHQDASEPAAASAAVPPADKKSRRYADDLYRFTKQAAMRRDVEAVHRHVSAFRSLPKTEQTTAGFNMAMEALFSVHKSGQPIAEITSVYTEMIENGLEPNNRTYGVLVKALCARDVEIQQRLIASSKRATPSNSAEMAELDKIRKEDNFEQAMELMGVAHQGKHWFSDAYPYNALLRSCAIRGDVDRAIDVLDLLERSSFANVNAQTFKHLIHTFTFDSQLKPDESTEEQQTRKLAACKQVFEEFLEASSKNPNWEHDADVVVWTALITAHFRLGDTTGAVALFERMLSGSSEPKQHVPTVNCSTVSAMLRGFLGNKDLPTALDWFRKVVSDEQLPLPDCSTLEMLMTPLAAQPDLVEPFNRIFEVYIEKCDATNWTPQLGHLAAVVDTNCQVADALTAAGKEQEVQKLLDKAMEFVALVYSSRMSSLQGKQNLSSKPSEIIVSLRALCDLSDALLRSGRIVDAASIFTYSAVYLQNADRRLIQSEGFLERLTATGQSFFAITNKPLLASPGLHLLAAAEFVAPVLRQSELLDETFAAGLAQLYRQARNDADGKQIDELPLSSRGWSMVLDAFCFEETNLRPLDLQAFKQDGIAMLLGDLAQLPAQPKSEGSAARPKLELGPTIALISKRYSSEGLETIADWMPASSTTSGHPTSPTTAASDVSAFGESDAASMPESSGSTQATSPGRTSPLGRVDLPPAFETVTTYNFPDVQVIDTDLGLVLTQLNKPAGHLEAPQLYQRLQEEMKVGTFANPEGICALISSFGRRGELEKVHELYAMAQHVMHGLVGSPKWQTAAWFHVEDAMISAYSHAGNAEAASLHRHRIIAAGGSPTATAYAALIATIRDTTDDAAIAQELFDESQRFGVKPSAYLFNTVISKLSRARKAESALQLFDDMTINHGIRPTSVTYGAVINACTRIGDEERAIQLFNMMESDRSFKPRVPPYNTMMQFYTQNVPDREKALVYYNKMVAAGVAPSAHTYKLLLDLYGAIEPVQPEKMEEVFDQIVNDGSVAVQGTHWASLINCYGCFLHDLDKAIATFESIATHPSTQANKGRTTLPDAVSFEALLAVFVAHHRTDLMRSHLAKMRDSGIRMTAYVANLLIRGYSMDGPAGLEEARQLFESMVEPAAGVAAPGNHPPRAHGAGAPNAASSEQQPETPVEPVVSTPSHGNGSPFAAVHREPSTYEAMIRAELAHGHRDRAHQLVERMEARAFPPALLIRAASLIGEEQPAVAPGQETEKIVPDVLTNRHSFAPLSPRLGSGATVFNAHGPTSSSIHTSVRHASTAAGSASAPSTSNPAPGPPKPNSPFTIFDRSTKRAQKERAAQRKPIEVNASGAQVVGDEASRGEVSRVTDYVRNAIAESLADRVADIKRDFPTIVELGSGAGYLRHFIDPKATGVKKIIMCDTSEAMLRRDEHLDSTFPFEFERRVVDEEALPFEEASLDCIVVSGGLHWTNDLPGVLVQIRRALKPDGVFIAGLCGGDTLFELRTSLQLAEQEREGGISARVSPMADQRDMASLLQRAGFTLPTVDVDEVTIAYPSMFELVHDLRDMGESNAVINRRPQLRRDTLLAASAIYESLHALKPEEGKGVPATFSLIFLIGWAPAPTQPKPLRRGSAKHSLKEALQGVEGDVQKKAEEELSEEQKKELLKGFFMSIHESGSGSGEKK